MCLAAEQLSLSPVFALHGSHSYSSRDCAHLCSVVSVVTGTMVALDREAKHVRVSGDRTVPYDHVILCTGLQYQVWIKKKNTCKSGSQPDSLKSRTSLPG